jgi:hypothetical protein
MNGNQIVSNQAVANPGNEWHVAAVGDYNGDDLSDVVMQHDSGSLALWQMNGATIQANLAITGLPGDTQIFSPFQNQRV